MKSAEEKLLESLFTPADWVPLKIQEASYCDDAGIKLASEANTSIREYLTVNTPDEAMELFLEMVSGWAEGIDQPEERPCCEEDVERLAEHFLLSRERVGYRADAWALAQEHPEIEYDWDWFPRTYLENKGRWIPEAFEAIKIQKLTCELCEVHEDRNLRVEN